MIWLLANSRWLLGAVASVALSIALVIAKADARHWHKLLDQQTLLVEQAKRQAAEQEAANERRVNEAAQTYADRLASLKPIILRSTDTIHDYRQTPAGRVQCIAPDRVRDIDAFDAALNHSSATTTGTVPDTAIAPASGR